jgi:P27 family predicted phage terminase small subunit
MTGRSPGRDSGGRLLPEPIVVELVAAARIPDAPSELLPGGAGADAWTRLWTAGQAWLAPSTDFEVMSRLCQFYDEHRALWGEIGKQGYTVAGSKGQERLNPLLTRLQVVEASMIKLESLCGFTPSDRARLGIAAITAQSGLEKLLTDRAARVGRVTRQPRGGPATDD